MNDTAKTGNSGSGEPLAMEHRQAMIEALYRGYMTADITSALDPSRLARAAVMSDEDLLNTLLVSESNGDTEIAKVLAKLGFSEVPVHVQFAAVCAAEPAPGAADAIGLDLSVSQLRRFEIDHFTVRDLAEFGSLRMDLPPESVCVGYFSLMVEAGELLKGSAVLTNGPSREPMIAFEVECAVPNRLDVAYRTAPMRLSELREQVAQLVGEADVLSLADYVKNARWVHAPAVELRDQISLREA